MFLSDPGGCEHVHAKEAMLGELAQKARDLKPSIPCWRVAICGQWLKPCH